ncbi:MAG: AAA family ATPase [Candidatus Limnocylindrales bacterium]
MPEPLTSAPLDTTEAPTISFAPPFEPFEAATANGAGPSRVASSVAEPGLPSRERTSERSVDFQPISRTKITPPLLRRETLTRGRLIDRLRAHTQRRLTLVIAEAGYGKTTLLADYGRSTDVPCLWYKLDPSDGDWVTLANYLVAAFRELRPTFGSATESLLRQMAATEPPRRLVIDTMIAEIARLDDRALLILDDFHLVDANADAMEIVERLLREAPPGISMVLASRRRPDLGLARLAAQGEVAELSTDDLRFSRGETDELFSTAYQQPLDPDVLEQVDRRTEGWAASLQLFHSSIRGRSRLEIRAFARTLSGTEGPVYDFLAEEVLRDLTPPLRRFLVRAALLERIVPRLVVALFGDLPEPPSDVVARGWIEAADDLGLLGRRGESGRAYRFHPLLQEFLRRQLEHDESPAAIPEMHLRVARAAEGEDWLVACHHYLEAGVPSEAIRVMGESLLVAIGTGAWGTAAGLIDRFGGEPAEPAVQVILALREIQHGDVGDAEQRLNAIDLSIAPAEMRSLIRHALLRATFNRGDLDAARILVSSIIEDPASPGLVREIARVFQVVHLSRDCQITEVSRAVQALSEMCQNAGLSYFTAISLHNAMELELAGGRYREAYAFGEGALEFFKEAAAPASMASAHATLAICAAELRAFEAMAAHLAEASSAAPETGPDCLVTTAYLLSVLGDSDRADEALARAIELVDQQPTDAAVRTWLRLATARILVARGDSREAAELLTRSEPNWPTGPGSDAALLTISALAYLGLGQTDSAREAARVGLAEATARGAASWERRLRIIKAAIDRDGPALRAAVAQAERTSGLALLDSAEAVAYAADTLLPLPDELAKSMIRHPERWRQVLRGQLDRAPGPESFAAATALERIATLDDVPRLRAYESTYLRSGRGAGIGRRVAERESPTLRIHDLGRCRLDVGARSVELGSIRRRAASLLVYLIARPRQVATREKVLDDLWPDLAPPAAANSLNQTLYFLRRAIDPWYEEGVSADYLRFQGETLSLASPLVWIESVEFHRVAVEILGGAAPNIAALLECQSRYGGRFAPEFEYEDWTQDWRELLHTAYLHLVHRAQDQLVSGGNMDRAVAVTQAALAVDPRNPELHETLVWLFDASGSRAATAEQYARYANVHQEEVGAAPRSLSELVKMPFPLGQDL